MKAYRTLLLVFFAATQLAAQDETSKSMQSWQYPYEVHRLQISDSLNIAYVDEGQGKCTLLFIHGLGSNLKAWQKTIDSLRAEYRCIALDLPGYGKSAGGDFAYDMQFFAAAVDAFIKKMRLKNVVLVGHSMGGQVALHTVLNKNKNVEKLILLAPAGFETFSDAEKQWFRTIYTPAFLKATPEAQIIKNFELNFHQMPADARFMIDDRLAMRDSAADYEQYCAMIPKCVLGMLEQPVFERLPEIALPTLVLFGENDALIPNRILHPKLTTLEVAQGGQGRIPGSTLRMIPEAGHFLQWEQAGVVNSVILGFLGGG